MKEKYLIEIGKEDDWFVWDYSETLEEANDEAERSKKKYPLADFRVRENPSYK